MYDFDQVYCLKHKFLWKAKTPLLYSPSVVHLIMAGPGYGPHPHAPYVKVEKSFWNLYCPRLPQGPHVGYLVMLCCSICILLNSGETRFGAGVDIHSQKWSLHPTTKPQKQEHFLGRNGFTLEKHC